MRGSLILHILRTTFLRFWQPSCVIGGAVLAVIGTSITAGRLSLWLTPELGWAPAATVAGVSTCALALRWARMTIQEQR